MRRQWKGIAHEPGTVRSYRDGCRCDGCRAANSAYNAASVDRGRPGAAGLAAMEVVRALAARQVVISTEEAATAIGGGRSPARVAIRRLIVRGELVAIGESRRDAQYCRPDSPATAAYPARSTPPVAPAEDYGGCRCPCVCGARDVAIAAARDRRAAASIDEPATVAPIVVASAPVADRAVCRYCKSRAEHEDWCTMTMPGAERRLAIDEWHDARRAASAAGLPFSDLHPDGRPAAGLAPAPIPASTPPRADPYMATDEARRVLAAARVSETACPVCDEAGGAHAAWCARDAADPAGGGAW